MNRLNIALLSLSLFAGSAVAAEPYMTVPVEASGTVTAYVDVPTGFDCHVAIPDAPTAFCAGPGNIVYHLRTVSTVQGVVDPDRYFEELMQLATSASNVRILARYAIPEISQYRLQRDAPLLFLRGQQVYTYGLDSTDPDKNETGVSAIVISIFPNNGAPMSIVDAYGITLPSSVVDDLGRLRRELVAFVNSYRYDEQWVQLANAQTVQFEGNLSARENAFYSTQRRIHQNNMDALDQSYNAYRDRSAAAERMQQGTVSAIHERQQLINPATGARYEADGYYDYNYVNPNDPGMSVRTNDPLWDPNLNTQQGEYYERLENYAPSNW